jgi:LuxR family maltose regulon positive regulatory protein
VVGVVALERPRSPDAARHSSIPALRRAGAKTVLAGFDDDVLGIEVVESKLRVPDASATGVSRTPLVNRLRAATTSRVAVVVAPPGYGKTTLLAQWAGRDARPFTWLSVDQRDNEPIVLLRHIAAALDRVSPLSPAVAETVQRSTGSIWESAIPRLSAEIAAIRTAFVFVLDDADVLESSDCLDAVQALFASLPAGSTLVLSGRVRPKLPLAALRAEGGLLEIGPDELAFSRREAELLLRQRDVEPSEEELSDLLERTEGWVAGINLAVLAACESTTGPPQLQLGGDDRHFAEYFHAESLSRLTPELRTFLMRTAVLEKLCGSLCDALLGGTGSNSRLENIEEANVFVSSLDHRREWFRCHPLLRELLLRELVDQEPELVADLHLRAAQWYEAHDDPESALAHARSAGDDQGMARLLASIAFHVHDPRRLAAVEAALEHFDDDELLERNPSIAALGCSVHAQAGRPAEAGRWLKAAERGLGAAGTDAALLPLWVATTRSTMCADGPAQMDADASLALAQLPEDDRWRPVALLSKGVAAVLLGEPERAELLLADATAESERLGLADTFVVAIAERSLLAAARDCHPEADELAMSAVDLVETKDLGERSTSALSLVLSARTLLRRGQWDRARQRLTQTERLTPTLTEAIPWLALQVRLELGAAYVTLRDRDAARRSLDAAQELLLLRPELGTLVAGVSALEDGVESLPPETGVSGLTRAELRVLPFLPTHLTFREIAEQVGVTRNTIKTQAISIYHKLGATTRSEAVARAEDLGLVEVKAAPKVFRLRPATKSIPEPRSVAL